MDTETSPHRRLQVPIPDFDEWRTRPIVVDYYSYMKPRLEKEEYAVWHEDGTDDMKFCHSCHKLTPHNDEFDERDMLRSYCIPCRVEQSRIEWLRDIWAEEFGVERSLDSDFEALDRKRTYDILEDEEMEEWTADEEEKEK